MEAHLLSGANLEIVFNEMLEGCQIIDRHYRYIYVNDTVCKQGRQSREQLLGQTMMSVYPGIENTEMFHLLKHCMREGKPQQMENEFTYPSGDRAWFELRMEPVSEGVLIFSFDITERKKMEISIRAERERYQKVLENLEDIVHIMDPAGQIFYVTPSVERVLGYTPQEFMRKRVLSYIHPDDVEKARKVYASILKYPGRVFQSIEERALHKDGEYRTMQVVAINLLDNPAINGVVITSRDITKEREVDRAKSEFVSLASHQLRTPLGIAKWYLEALQEEPYIQKSPEVVRSYFEEIYKNNHRVLGVVRALLSVSKIDQGHIKDTPKHTNLVPILEDIVKEMRILAKQKNIHLRLTINSLKECVLWIDPVRLYEVIENLVTNAIEYTLPNGSVSVALKRDANKVQVTVRDTGIGISKIDQPKLFSKFFRSEKGALNNTEGSGLGLYVAKSYVEDWGGSLTVTSTPGKGSCFTIELPNIIKRHQQKEEGI